MAKPRDEPWPTTPTMGFCEWRDAVDRRMLSVYAITVDDAGIDDQYLAYQREVHLSPNEFVEWFGVKCDLNPSVAVDRNSLIDL